MRVFKIELTDRNGIANTSFVQNNDGVALYYFDFA